MMRRLSAAVRWLRPHVRVQGIVICSKCYARDSEEIWLPRGELAPLPPQWERFGRGAICPSVRELVHLPVRSNETTTS